jgi:hypothetical protein
VLLTGILTHLSVLGVWMGAAATLVGIGALLLRTWRGRLEGWRDLSLAFWLGIVGAIGILQVWHLALPVDAWALALLAGIGLAGLWTVRRDLTGVLRRANGSLTLIAVLLVVWVANRALGATALFDTGMYHQPVVAWANEYPLVPGLANLHGRLGFNASSLLLASVLDLGPLDGASLHFLNGLLFAVLATEGVAAWSTARGTPVPRAHDLFSLAILPNVLHGVVRQDVRSLSTDAAVCALLFVGVRALFDLLAHLPASQRERALRVAPIVLLFTGAVTVKLSAAMIAAAGALVALHSLRGADPMGAPGRGRFTRWLAPATVVFAVWLVRGALLSGFPLYPSALLALPVDWRVPAEQVSAEAGWITMSARNLNSNVIYPAFSWIGPWLRGVVVRGDPFAQLTVPVLVTVAVAGFAWRARRRAARPLWNQAWTRVAIPSGMGIVFWLASAPHTRMAQGLFWSTAAIALSWWASSGGATPRGREPARALLRVVVVITALLLSKQVAGAAWRGAPGARTVAAFEALVTLPRGGRWMAPLPRPELRPLELPGGLSLAVPVNDNACWNAPVLCTPHPSAGLRLRRSEGTLASRVRWGFRSADGSWSPERWPNPWTPYLAWWRCVRRAERPDTSTEYACLAMVGGDSALSAAPARPRSGSVARETGPVPF